MATKPALFSTTFPEASSLGAGVKDLRIAAGEADGSMPVLIEIRIPFCVGRCACCREQVIPANRETVSRYTSTILLEAEAVAQELSSSACAAVRLCGGNPLYMRPDGLDDLLSKLKGILPCRKDTQWMLSANPNELSAATLTVIRNAGIHAIDLNVMTCRMDEFALLQRPYYFAAFDGAMSLLTMFRQRGVCIRLLTGIPGQTEATLLESVRHALLTEPDSVEFLPFGAQMEPLPAQVGSFLIEQGFEAVTPARYMRCGVSRRDWVLEARGCFEQYGIGAGAVTRLNGMAYRNTTDVSLYMKHATEPEVIARPWMQA